MVKKAGEAQSQTHLEEAAPTPSPPTDLFSFLSLEFRPPSPESPHVPDAWLAASRLVDEMDEKAVEQALGVLPKTIGSRDPTQFHKDALYLRSEQIDYTKGQRAYELFFNKTILKTAQTLKSNPAISLGDLMDCIAGQRHKFAQSNDTQSAHLFGIKRQDGNELTTQISEKNRYAAYLNRLDAKEHQIGLSHVGAIRIISPAEPVSVRTITHGSMNLEVRNKNMLLIEEEFRKFQHNISSMTNEQALEALASMHWDLAQNTFYRRGSAAISEMLIHGIARAHGILIGGIKPGIMPDLEAIMTPKEEFVKNYKNFFESVVVAGVLK